MVTAFYLAGASAAGLCALYWATAGRHHRPEGTGHLSGVMITFALVLLVFIPSAQPWRTSLRPDLDLLIGNSAILAVGLALRLLLLRLNHHSERNRHRGHSRMAAGVVTTAAATALVLATPPPPGTLEGLALHSLHPALGLHTVLCSLYLCFATTDFLRHAWRQARFTTSPAVRLGLLTATVGFMASVLFSILRFAMVLGLLFNWGPVSPPTLAPTSAAVPALSLLVVAAPGTVLLVTLGLTLPAAAHSIRDMRRRRWEQASYTELERLWSELVSVNPQIVLPGITGDEPSDYLLHRRVVEISDGILALRPYHSQAVQRAAAHALRATGERLDTPQSAAIIEAAVLAAAVHAKRRGWQPTPRQAQRVQTSNPVTDLREETRRLRRLARAYTHYDATSIPHQPEPTAPTAATA